jgi:hypothetical protein
MHEALVHRLLQYCVVDIDVASEDKAGCGPYACAVLCGRTFVEMHEWFVDNAPKKSAGVFVDSILSCLLEHGMSYDSMHLSGTLRRVADSSLLRPSVHYLLVAPDHVVVCCNKMVNERCKGGWVHPRECKNRRIDQVYRVFSKRGSH